MFSRAYFVMACVVALTLEVRAQEVQTPSAASSPFSVSRTDSSAA